MARAYLVLFSCAWVLSFSLAVDMRAPLPRTHTKRQADFLNFPPLPYHQSNSFFHQQFPPQPQPYHQPLFRQNFQHTYHPQPQPQPEYSPYILNDIHFRNQPNPYVQDYPLFQYNVPQFDDGFQDLNTLNRVPAFREPIQIIPSRFPPPLEKFVERIQNYFSVYNPPLGVIYSPVAPNFNINATDNANKVGLEPTTPAAESDGMASATTSPNETETSSNNSNDESVTAETSNENEVVTETVTERSSENATESEDSATEQTTVDSSS